MFDLARRGFYSMFQQSVIYETVQPLVSLSLILKLSSSFLLRSYCGTSLLRNFIGLCCVVMVRLPLSRRLDVPKHTKPKAP
jgi:hypothetical protein